MMKSIIKCLSGKLSKQFFIILLISCFTLLVNSSVNAYVAEGNFNWYDLEFGEYIYGNSGQYAGTVSDNAFNFSSKYFSYTTVRNNTLENKLNYWWQSDGLHYTRKYWNESSPINGKIDGFYVCSQRPYMQTAYSRLANASFCTYKEGFSELSMYLNGTDKYSISCNSSNTYTNCMVCLYEYGVGNYICIDDGNSSNNDSEFIGVSQIESVATDNPYVSSSSNTYEDSDVIWVFEDDDHLQNRTYMEILESLGYSTGLCYSNFNIDSLGVAVDSSQCLSENCVFSQFIDDSDCDDSELFCGASVLDLKAGFLSGANDRVWFQNFYNIWKSSYNHYNINWYVGKSKGYWYLPYKLYNAVEEEWLNFDPDDYFYYCRNVIDGYDPNAYKTGGVSNDVKDAMNEKGSVVLSGVDFSGSKDLFGLFNNFYTKLRDGFKVEDSYHDITGILPSYIIFGFFLFVLIYGLKR